MFQLNGMRFTTPVEIEGGNHLIRLGAPVLGLGSCFADRIGARMQSLLFRATINPTGISYNPHTLAANLSPKPSRPSLFFHHGLWRSFHHHSSVGSACLHTTEENIRIAEERRTNALEGAEVLLLTLGTANIFSLVNGQRPVANCHRLPQKLFARTRLPVREITKLLADPLVRWLDAGEKRLVILTVSPVRHLRDGLIENNRGKAALLLACEALEQIHPRLEYFPAYEILIDELRDYRFFGSDMAHPTEQAVDYIWEKFCERYFTVEDRRLMGKIEKLRKFAQHRLTENSDREAWARKGLQLTAELETLRPELSTAEIRAAFSSREDCGRES